MKCLERERLFAYTRHLLDAPEEEALRAHVVACPVCLGTLEEYEKLDTILNEWQPAEPSAWFDAQVHQAVAAEEQTRTSSGGLGLQWGWWWIPATVMALAALSLVVYRARRSVKPAMPLARTVQQAPVPTVPPSATQQEKRPSLPPTEMLTATARTPVSAANSPQLADEEVQMYENMTVLENYDLLANFDVLSELPHGGKKIAN
jgi:hypothetical protein